MGPLGTHLRPAMKSSRAVLATNPTAGLRSRTTDASSPSILPRFLRGALDVPDESPDLVLRSNDGTESRVEEPSLQIV